MSLSLSLSLSLLNILKIGCIINNEIGIDRKKIVLCTLYGTFYLAISSSFWINKKRVNLYQDNFRSIYLLCAITGEIIDIFLMIQKINYNYKMVKN